jgi:hypothetical protein
MVSETLDAECGAFLKRLCITASNIASKVGGCIADNFELKYLATQEHADVRENNKQFEVTNTHNYHKAPAKHRD